jgi:protease I
MTSELKGKRVAILAEDGFEQSELTEPRRALLEAGADAKIVSPVKGKVKGWRNGSWADEVDVDMALDDAKVEDFDALLLPGGVINPDRLRTRPKAVAFARGFVEAKKPVAAICHGPWLLVEADVVRGRTMTGWPSIRTDLRNAGAKVVDQEAVCEGGILTSRSPDDIPAFNREMIRLFAGESQKQRAA